MKGNKSKFLNICSCACMCICVCVCLTDFICKCFFFDVKCTLKSFSFYSYYLWTLCSAKKVRREGKGRRAEKQDGKLFGNTIISLWFEAIIITTTTTTTTTIIAIVAAIITMTQKVCKMFAISPEEERKKKKESFFTINKPKFCLS